MTHIPTRRKFQSTPSAWRETFRIVRNRPRQLISIHSLRMEGDFCVLVAKHRATDFNPLPPHGGRHLAQNQSDAQKYISIHSLRMEGDIRGFRTMTGKRLFQSTPSAWRETKNIGSRWFKLSYFNPLPPHGGRRHCVLFWNADRKFQSTPSAWRETQM